MTVHHDDDGPSFTPKFTHTSTPMALMMVRRTCDGPSVILSSDHFVLNHVSVHPEHNVPSTGSSAQTSDAFSSPQVIEVLTVRHKDDAPSAIPSLLPRSHVFVTLSNDTTDDPSDV
ncbi:hypothetical protein HAX54_033601 [Datura stramonium]|uniref:Uncharacterized protein n=1 Tax=Datura stramonium TaxID=4076 RepID=A0ABS8VD90_DATST|nr:hypothetical protein [Datura stramonium]